MAEKKEKKRCEYKSLFVERCLHDYFATYADPATGEETDYCIFHAPMELKEGSVNEFWEAFDAYFKETKAGYKAEKDEEKKKEIKLDCRGFVFPDTGDRFVHREFPFSVSFYRATFSGDVYFGRATFSAEAAFQGATFSRDASFYDATFSGAANFRRAKFSGKAYFLWAKFSGDADFEGAKFSGEADFERAAFSGKTSFAEAAFSGEATFGGAKFTGKANFYEATFSGKADFYEATFSGEADFLDATFSGEANFCEATFSGEAYFYEATFAGEANFQWATFSGKASFFDATFSGEAYFYEATFSDEADFRMATFSGEISLYRSKFDEDASFQKAYVAGRLEFPETEFYKSGDLRDISMFIEEEDGTWLGPGAVLFDNTYFHQPERVQIGGKETDLAQWSFKDTNVEEVRFVNEKWGARVRRRGRYEEAPLKLKLWPFKLNGRKVVYDEILAEEDKDKADDERRVTWEDAGQVYRRLRKKFEGELAYELTSDFHYGQMECRRLNSDRPLLHPDRVVAFLYKIVSGYGERFGLPLLWLLGSFVVFTGAFMFLGYKPAGENEVIWRFCSPGEMFACGFWNWVLDLGKAVTFTLRAAVTFRLKDITKDPVIFLAHFWKLFAVIFGTFFILALRRRFKK